MKTESRIQVTEAVEGVKGICCFLGIEFHFGIMKRLWRWMVVMVA